MKRITFSLILFLMPILLYGQFSPFPLSSSDFLKSGIIFGTGRERHFSMRTEALGRDFSGFVSDQITDLYRNPAFFSKMENPILFGEVIKRLPSSSWVPFPVRNLSPSKAPSAGIRLGYAKTFGLLFRGNHLNSPFTSTSSTSHDWYSSNNTVDTKNQETWAEVQTAWSFPISGKLYCGVSYTFGMGKILDSYETESTYNRKQLSFFSYDSTYKTRQWLTKYSNEGKSHIARVGLLWNKTEGILWDFVATIEVFSANLTQDDHSQGIRTHTKSPIGAPILSISENSYLQNRLMSVDIEATNLGIDLRFLNSSNKMKTFAVQFGARVAFFSSNDKNNSLNYSYSFEESSSDTSKNISSSYFNSVALPSGSGLQINGGVGWNFRLNDFLIAIVALGNFRYLNYDYDARYQSSDTLTTITPDTTVTATAYYATRSVPHHHQLTLYRLALPLGVEYEVIRNLHLRAGWVVQFLGGVNKETSTEESSHATPNRLDYSTVTFGIGYQISDRFRVDLLNLGEIDRLRDWNLSLILSF